MNLFFVNQKNTACSIFCPVFNLHFQSDHANLCQADQADHVHYISVMCMHANTSTKHKVQPRLMGMSLVF